MFIISYLYVEMVLVFGASLAQTNYFIFKNYLMTRDEAHFCCRKYGMTLMSIRSSATNTFLSKSLKESQHATIWLGIFNDPSNVKEMVWFNSTTIEYNNFNSPTKDILDGMAANKTNSTDLCMYAEVTDNMIWKIKHCEEKIDFGCEIIGPDIQVLPASLKDIICPDLLKMTSDDITRGGVIPSPNSTKNTKAETYGHFKREDMLHSMGKGIGYEKTESNVDCLLRCLMKPGCNDVIILDKFHCLLYQQ